jgi:hypothetical protein
MKGKFAKGKIIVEELKIKEKGNSLSVTVSCGIKHKIRQENV